MTDEKFEQWLQVYQKMIGETIAQELQMYRREIEETVARVDPDAWWDNAAPELLARFKAFALEDIRSFRYLCTGLLKDEKYEIRYGTLKLLHSLRIRDNILAIIVVGIALHEKDLREEALGTLWSVGTYRVLPQILLFAEKGYSEALYMARRLLRTPEEIERGIAIARKYIAVKDYALREAALFLLQKYSSMEVEAERVLVAVQKYKDELHIDALKKAPPEMVLEPLKVLRAPIEEKYAEYKDLTATIDVLEKRLQEKK